MFYKVVPPWCPVTFRLTVDAMSGEHEQAVSKPKKMAECGGGANTRFAPTKVFQAFVGVNLVFTLHRCTMCRQSTSNWTLYFYQRVIDIDKTEILNGDKRTYHSHKGSQKQL